MARYAIGDIQGCMASLERLLAQIGFTAGRDELWLVGDLVNRGPRSLDVLRWAKANERAITSVLGNHDLHLLGRFAGSAPAKPRDTLDELLAAPDREHLIDWLRARPLFHSDPTHALVHAGLHPRWTIDIARARAGEVETELRGPRWREYLAHLPERARTTIAYLTRARMLRADGSLEPEYNGPPTGAPSGTVPWFRFPDPAWTTHSIVFGHWAALGLDLGPRHAALDSGCVWGKQLTALRLADRTIYQVKSVEAAS